MPVGGVRFSTLSIPPEYSDGERGGFIFGRAEKEQVEEYFNDCGDIGLKS